MPCEVQSFPAFSWSHGRDRTLRRCQRMYYWRYYGGHGGWLADADPVTRQAWVLKHLTTISGALGQEIHARASEIADAIRGRDQIPTLEELIDRTRRGLNRLWRASGDRDGFHRSPKRHPMLLERYRRIEPANDRLQRVRERMERCLRHLRESEIWEEVRGADEVIRWEPTDPTEYRQTIIYAPADLVYRASDVQPFTVLDWKTGADDPEVVEQQLAVYGLVLRERFGYEPPFRGLVVDLDEGKVRSLEISSRVLAAAERRIRDSIYEMRRFVVDLDLERNEPRGLDACEWPVDTTSCKWCNYYDLCAADLSHATHLGPF